MCNVCDEFGALGCPACEPEEYQPETFHCQWCGEDFEPEEAVLYNGDYYCGECYRYEKEEEEAGGGDFLPKNTIYQTIKLFT
jgi:hypothetical protein